MINAKLIILKPYYLFRKSLLRREFCGEAISLTLEQVFACHCELPQVVQQSTPVCGD